MGTIEKAYEITDAKITFVSLVDRAANKKKFLLKKEAGGKASFTTFGRIVKKDAQSHYVTGVVYEPMTEDSHGNYMTELEIEKAAHWFAKNGNQVDLQHSFEPLEGAAVVESWIAKADFEIEGETIRKGTWLMTVEITDKSVWAGIEKGSITGFSMGGIGNYSEEDVDLDDVTKSGGDVVEKGAMADAFGEHSKHSLFWDAFNTLQEVLNPYDPITGQYSFETDEAKIREAMTEFGAIITDVLTSKEPIAKALEEALPVTKAGKAMSQKNRETLTGIRDSLDAFLKSLDSDGDPDADNNGASKTVQKEGKQTMTKQEITEAVAEGVRKGLEKSATPDSASAAAQRTPEITPESVQKMVEDTVAKAMEPKPAPEITMTPELVEALIQKTVEAAVEPLRRARGLPSSLGSASGVEKQEEPHYLYGIL